MSVGVFAAWLTTQYRFPGRARLDWALILPLAMPAYVIAYAYTDLLQFSGPGADRAARADRLARRATTGFRRSARSAARPRCSRSCCIPTCTCSPAPRSWSSRGARSRRRGSPGYGAWRQLLPRGAAARAPGDRRRHGARADGDARRFRRRCPTSACRPSPPASIAPGCRWASAWPPRSSPRCLLGFVVLVLLLERATPRPRALPRDVAAHARRRRAAPARARAAAVALAACAAPVVLGFLLPAGLLLRAGADRRRCRSSAARVRADRRTASRSPASPRSLPSRAGAAAGLRRAAARRGAGRAPRTASPRSATRSRAR